MLLLDHHTHLVARPLAEIITKYDIMEMHVSLTNGLWRYESWGYPVGKKFIFTIYNLEFCTKKKSCKITPFFKIKSNKFFVIFFL